MAKTNADTVERRRFSRIPFEAAVSISNPRGIWHAKLLDISLKGILITRPQSWTLQNGDPLLVEVHPPEQPFSIRMEMKAAHISDDSVGFECTHIDIDSASHLRRLVELNIGDDRILNRELSELFA
jgi:hypothetical protein